MPGLCTAVVKQQELHKINTFTLGFYCVPSIGRTCDLRYQLYFDAIHIDEYYVHGACSLAQ